MSAREPVTWVVCGNTIAAGWNEAARRVRCFTGVTLPTSARSVGSCE